jgi:hypothetical protein
MTTSTLTGKETTDKNLNLILSCPLQFYEYDYNNFAQTFSTSLGKEKRYIYNPADFEQSIRNINDQRKLAVDKFEKNKYKQFIHKRAPVNPPIRDYFLNGVSQKAVNKFMMLDSMIGIKQYEDTPFFEYNNRPVNNKWIYIFTAYENQKFNTFKEYLVSWDVSKNVQEFQMVDWSKENEIVWKDAVKRPVIPKKIKELRMLVHCDNYILLSAVPIPTRRLKKYQRDVKLLKSRALFMPSGTKTSIDTLDGIGNNDKSYLYNTIMLLDYVDIALFLAEPANKALEAYAVFHEQLKNDSAIPKKVAQAQLAKLTEALANQYEEVKDNVNYELLVAYNQKNMLKSNLLENDLDTYSNNLLKWINSPGYLAALDDYQQSKENLEKICARQRLVCFIISQTENGQKQLMEYLADPDSWYSRIYSEKENDIGLPELWQATRKTITFMHELSGAQKDSLAIKMILLQNRIAELFKNQGILKADCIKNDRQITEIVKRRNELNVILKNLKGKNKNKIFIAALKERALIEITAALDRWGFAENDVKKIKFLDKNCEKLIVSLSENTSQTARKKAQKGVYRAQLDVLDELKNRAVESNHLKQEEYSRLQKEIDAKSQSLDDLGKQKTTANSILGPIFITVEMVNVVAATIKYADVLEGNGTVGEKLIETVDAIGSLADATAALEDVISKVIKDKEIISVKSIVSKSGSTSLEFSKLALSFGVIKVVSNICDITVSLNHITDLIKERRNGQVIGEALIIFGNTIEATGTVLGFLCGKLMTDTIFLGLSLGGWITIAAALLVVIGTILIWIFRPRPYKEWAEQSPWSRKNYSASRYEQLSADEIHKHFTRIYNVLTEFDFETKVKMKFSSTGSKQYIGPPGANLQPDYQEHYTFDSVALMVKLGAFDKKKSRFWIDYQMNFDDSYTSGGLTFLKLNHYELSYQNSSFCIMDNSEYLVKHWTIDELEVHAKKSGYLVGNLQKLFNTLKTKSYDHLQFPSVWNNDARYIACLTPDYSVDKKGHFQAEWKIRLDYDGTNGADVAFSEFQNEHKYLFPIVKIKKGSNGDIDPEN